MRLGSWLLVLVKWGLVASTTFSANRSLNVFDHQDGLSIVSGDDGILCEIRTLDIEFAAAVSGRLTNTSTTNHDEITVCLTSIFDNVPQTYEITLPDEMNVRNGDRVWLRGPVRLDQEDASLVTTNATLLDIVPQSQIQGNHRNLQSSSVKLALIVRVTYRGRQPSLTASELQGRVFGRGPDRVRHSLRSQLEACSHDQYRIRVPRHEHVQGGVFEVTISKSVAGSANSVLALENLVVEATARRLGDSAWWRRLSHILVVLPHHDDIRFRNNRHYLAYGYVGGKVTVFRNTWAGSLSALVHELGHNLNMQHSGRQGDVYGDVSGYMGYGIEQTGGPLMCFNGQKQYATGWYHDRTRHLFAQDLPYSGWLAFFGAAATDTAPNEPVILSLSVPGPERLFLQYNLARSFNAGTRSGRNAVTIVRDTGRLGETQGLQSWWVGAIGQDIRGVGRTQRYYVRSLGGDLVFTICDTIQGPPPKVHVSIYLDRGDGPSSNLCRDSIMPYCDDDLYASFNYNGNQRNCGWLIRRQDVGNIYETVCGDASHKGYQACPETCGACRDNCHDQLPDRFWVNSKLGWQTCAWLSSRVEWQRHLCVVDHDAFRLCGESCNRCD